MVIKKFNRSESAQKIHARRDRCQVHAHQFWWSWLIQFRRYCYFQKRSNSPWSSENLIDRNRPKKFMQVRIDDKCMHTNFGGRSLSSFGDIATFKTGQISPSDHGL